MAVVGLSALGFGFMIQALGYALSLAVESPDDKSVTSALVALGLATLAALVIVGGERITRRRRLRSLFLAVHVQTRSATDRRARPPCGYS